MRARIIAIIFLIGQALSLPTFAQSWSGNTRGIANQAINCVAVKPDGGSCVVFVGCRANANLPTLWRTFNGGARWIPVQQFSDVPITIECIAFDMRKPQTILVHGSDESSVWRSLDGGETWVKRVQDRENTRESSGPTAARDTTFITWEPPQHISNSQLLEAAPRLQVSANNVFLMWVTPSAAYSFFARSSDLGVTWSAPTILPDSASDPGNWYYSSNMYAVSEPYVYFMTQHRTAGAGPESYHLWFRRWTIGDPNWGNGRVLVDSVTPSILSSSGNEIVISHYGAPQFSGPYFAFSSDSGNHWTRFPPGLPFGDSPRAMALVEGHLYITRLDTVFGRREVKFSSSTDHGATWKPEVFLSSLDTILSDQPHLTADSVGNVYVAWRDGKYGTTTGFNGTILLCRSKDNGETWEPEQMITPGPSGGMPCVSIDGQTVVIVWDDERIIGVETVFTVRGRVSFDRGQTWSGEFLIAPPPQGGGGSDVLVSGGFVHVAWAQYVPSFHGDIFYRRGRIVSTEITPSGVTIPNEVKLMQNYPNPFNGETQLEFWIPSRMKIFLEVFDLVGRRVSTLVDKNVEAGGHTVSWNTTLSSGLYIARLVTPQGIFQRKLLLIR